MPARYLLDTNIASYLIREQHNVVGERLRKEQRDAIAISVVTEGELIFGIARRPDGKRLRSLVDDFLARMLVLPWDSLAAREYGHLRARLETRGIPMGNLDMMLAAYALAHSMTLVTNDKAFKRIPGLRLEDWSAS